MNKCQYKKCKALAQYETTYGKFCPYHYRVLKEKKGIEGKRIRKDKQTTIMANLINKFKFSKNVQINLQGR